MAKTKQEKKNLIESYTENLNGSKAFFIITPTEITPNEVNELRKKLHRENSTFVFVKNTLFKKALQNIEKKDIDNLDLRNQKAVLFSKNDPSTSAKILYDFIKEIKKGQIEGGILEDFLLTKENIEELAKLPGRDQMLSITVSTISAPLSNFVTALEGNILNLLYALKGISEEKN